MTSIEQKRKPYKILFTENGVLKGRFYLSSYRMAREFINHVNKNEKYFTIILPNHPILLN